MAPSLLGLGEQRAPGVGGAPVPARFGLPPEVLLFARQADPEFDADVRAYLEISDRLNRFATKELE